MITTCDHDFWKAEILMMWNPWIIWYNLKTVRILACNNEAEIILCDFFPVSIWVVFSMCDVSCSCRIKSGGRWYSCKWIKFRNFIFNDVSFYRLKRIHSILYDNIVNNHFYLLSLLIIKFQNCIYCICRSLYIHI